MTRWMAVVWLLLVSSGAAAEGSVEAGQAKSITCAACHGPDGNSVNPEWPSLAGQHPSYTVRQLKAFQSGARENVLMSSQAMGLTEQDMEDLAAYYAAQRLIPKEADPAKASIGERLYRGGNMETSVSACIACHGPRGGGNSPAAYPSIQGQHAIYTAAQLRAYKDGTRSTDPNRMMRDIATLLNDDEIDRVASYIQGLR